MTSSEPHKSKLPKKCTEEWFKTTILTKLNIPEIGIDVKIVELNDISGGYMSYMTKVTLEWSGVNASDKLPKSLMMKVVTLEKLTQAMRDQGLEEDVVQTTMKGFAVAAKNIHKNECYMYGAFLQNPNLSVKVPTCFAAEVDVGFGTDAFLLMEDISAISGNIPLHEEFSIVQAKRLIDAVVEIQAQSIKDTSWMDKVHPMEAKDFAEMTDQMDQFLDTVRAKTPKAFENITNDQIKPFCDVKLWTELAIEGYYEWPVLVHGDLWTNNAMFEKIDGKFTDNLVAVIDWQVVHRGQPGEDLSRIIGIHMGSDLRKACEEELLLYYYERLESHFGGTPPFPFSYVKDWYKKSMTMQAMFMMMLQSMLSNNFTDEQNTRTAQRSGDLLRDVIHGYYKTTVETDTPISDTHQTKLPKECTVDWFKKTILTKLNIPDEGISLKIAELKDITGGYMSYMTKVKLEWSGPSVTENLPRSLMFKAITITKMMTEMKKQGLEDDVIQNTVGKFKKVSNDMHTNECYMYDEFLKTLNVKVPMCFAAVTADSFEADSYLLMEDISGWSGNVPLYQGFNLEQAKVLIDAVVEVQAQSMKDTSWSTRLHKMDGKDFEEMMDNMHMFLETAQAKNPKEYEGITNELLKNVTDINMWMELSSDGFYQWPVLVHGDLWTNNVMFEKKEDGTFTDKLIAVIDWQLVHCGQPGEDLSRITGLHMESKLRKAHEKELLKYYYQQLEKHFDGSAPFPFVYVQDWYEKSMTMQALFLLMLQSMQSANYNDEQRTTTAQRAGDLLRDVLGGYYKTLELKK